MPTLSKTRSDDSFLKLIFIGNSGAGKTGGLASLVEAGWNLRILDFDNGLDPLAEFTSEKALSRVSYITLTDVMIAGKKKPKIKGVPTVWKNAMKYLTRWKTDEEDFGPLEKWTWKDVLVIDSLTYMSLAALHHSLFDSGRGEHSIQIQDWGDAMQKIEGVLEMLKSTGTHCNVIVNAHITHIGGIPEDKKTGQKRVDPVQFPNTLGEKLPPKVSSFFNSMLKAQIQGHGRSAKRVIKTTPDPLLDLKCPFSDLPEYLPLETGMATYFKRFYGKTPLDSE